MVERTRPAVSLHAWMCGCGEYGVTDGQRASRVALEDHLARSGHPAGEYYYGCPGQRTRIGVSATVTEGARVCFTHRLLTY